MHCATPKKRVLIVDDHPLVLEGLQKMIELQDDLSVCGSANDAPTGLTAFENCLPDVAIIDISLSGGSGIDLIRRIHASYPNRPILALSMHHENLYAERAIHAGAMGYVMKSDPVTTVLTALRKVLNGHIAVSDNVADRLIGTLAHTKKPSAANSVASLTDRELEIFLLFGQGVGTRHIATRLHLAVSTVESYRASIKIKLGLRNATELVNRASQFVLTRQ